MQKNIEVELRGPLTEESYKKLLNYLEANGNLVKKENRFLIDYSTFLEGIGERKSDIRTRITNGKVELIVKKGRFGGASREEASVFVENNDLDRALHFMSLLGYKKGVAADRGIVRYQIGGIEIAIQDVRVYGAENKIHSRFFEAEIMSAEDGKKEAEMKIKKFLKNLGLSFFQESDWIGYVEKMNKETNGVFDYEKDSVDKIRFLGK